MMIKLTSSSIEIPNSKIEIPSLGSAVSSAELLDDPEVLKHKIADRGLRKSLIKCGFSH
jgi:hypothetical protein